MDTSTQQSLTTIHQHLMENGRVKSKFMTNSSQLVNDKKVKKDRLMNDRRDTSGTPGATEHVESSSTTVKLSHVTSEESPARVVRVREEKKIEGGGKKEVSDTLSNYSTQGLVKSQSTQSSYLTNADSNIDSGKGHQDDTKSSNRLANLKAVTPRKKKISPSKKFTSGLASVKLRSVNRLKSRTDSGQSVDSGSSVGSSSQQEAKQKLTWMETLKKKQKSLRLKQLDNIDDNAEKNSVAAVTLRKISPRKKQRTTPPSTPTEEKDAAAPWSKVQLRTTPNKKRESMTPTLQPTGAAPSTISLQPSILSSGSWNSNTSSSTTPSSWVHVLPPVTTAATQPTEESSSSLILPSLCCVGDSIDLNSLPKKVFPTDEGEAVIFPFLNANNGGGSKEKEMVVIVGKSVILTASITASSSSSSNCGPRKASITWWARRADIRALTLNVEATGATLAHSHGRTPLLFESADVCLDFAQAFYRGPPTSAVVKSVDDDGGSAPVPADEKNTGPQQDNLTKDEESLLDRYRQYSQDERIKLRLTCVSPHGEAEEVEVSVSPQSSTKTAASCNEKDNNEAQALSEEEEQVASKYLKMLKMGIPPDAVQHKMTSDGIQLKIVDAVLGDGGDKSKATEEKEPVGTKLTNEEEVIATKYRKMMKMGVPADGVRHKMTMEGIHTKIISAVFDETEPAKQQSRADDDTPASSSQLSAEEEAIANKYRKMLKMGVPLEGVQHKMKLEGIDLKIVSSLAVGGASSSTISNAADDSATVGKPPASKSSAKAVGPTLSKEEDTIASKYRNMLKVCIPKEAVLHKMKQECVNAKIVEAVLGKEFAEPGGSNNRQKNNTAVTPAKANNRKTIAFHWTTSKLAPELLERSIFGLKKRKLSSINPDPIEESDIKKLEELFQKRNNNSKTPGKAKTSGQNEVDNEMAKLLDLTRANNIAISLKAFNDFTFRSLAETINDLDPDCKIVGERVQFIPNLLPTPKEVHAIKKYNGDDDKLITAELFFRQLVSIKRIEDKVKVMRTMSTFDEHVEEARAGFNTLQEVCSQVMESEKLIAVLEMVLNIGNLMNAGSLDGGVEAFKFESLPKLSQTKSADGKTTVLDYIVETFIEKGERQSLLLMSEFPDIQVS